mgnify:CR=1 FL=1
MIIYLQMLDTAADQDKFERLYLRYKNRMFAVARRILRSEQDAEDAVHQAFLSIIENFEKISEIECPETRAYIVIIVERKAIDIIRGRKRFADEFDEELAGLEFPLPGDHGLADAMARLPARYREVLLLRFDCGYTAAELADMLEMKPPAVRKLIWRAKAALALELEKEGDNG